MVQKTVHISDEHNRTLQNLSKRSGVSVKKLMDHILRSGLETASFPESAAHLLESVKKDEVLALESAIRQNREKLARLKSEDLL